MTRFTDFNLHADLMKGLDKMGFETPTEVQEKFIPEALKGTDVMASAQTGSGKTAAFLIPAFQKFLDNPDESKASRKRRGPRILVLTPTRELADQVMKVANELRCYTDMTVRSVVGGIPIMKHKRMLREVVDVLVATPGRLIDLMKQGNVHLRDVETFIIDEADRMLDMGFSTDVLKIAGSMGTRRQAMLLSATLDGKVGGVVNKIMKKPVSIELTQATQKHENITQCLYRANDSVHKQKMLDKLIEDQNIWQAVIFCGTKAMTERLAKKLKNQGEKVDFLNGDMRQSARNASIRRMQAGQIRFLIATDVAARGLDIKALTHVINFDMPRNSEDYIHRIGRVGRAGKTGDAISLVSNEQWCLMADVQKLIGATVEQKMIEGLEYIPGKSSGKKAKGSRDKGKRRPFNKSNSGRSSGNPAESRGGPKPYGKKKARAAASSAYAKSEDGAKSEGSYKGKKSFGSNGSNDGERSNSSYKGKKSFGANGSNGDERSNSPYKGKRSFKNEGSSDSGESSYKGKSKRAFGNNVAKPSHFKAKGGDKVKSFSKSSGKSARTQANKGMLTGKPKVRSMVGRIAN